MSEFSKLKEEVGIMVKNKLGIHMNNSRLYQKKLIKPILTLWLIPWLACT
jgi:hypothetical protein